MNGVKWALASRGVRGCLITLITWVLGALSYALTDVDQHTLITVLVALGSGAGALMSFYSLRLLKAGSDGRLIF